MGKLDDALEDIYQRVENEFWLILAKTELKKKNSFAEVSYDVDPEIIELVLEMLSYTLLSLLSKGKRKQAPFPVEKFPFLLESIDNEIEPIFSHIKNEVGFFSSVDDAQEKWKNAALSCYDANKSQFEAIKREHLLGPDLYNLNSGQERRDFFAKIYELVLKDHCSDWGFSIAARPIREAFQKLKSNRGTDQK